MSVAKQGGNVANVARKELEAKTGQKVVTSSNAKLLLKSKSSRNKK
jgi:mannose/fructose-specific phosphotransferase system component IIA